MSKNPAPHRPKSKRGAELIQLLLDETKKAELAARGLNHKRIAWQLGYTPEHFSRILNGQIAPSSRFERQAAALLKKLNSGLTPLSSTARPLLASNTHDSAQSLIVVDRAVTAALFRELKSGEVGQLRRVLIYCPDCGYYDLNHQAALLLRVVHQGHRTAAQVAARLKISEETASNRLRRLYRLGLVEREKQPHPAGGKQWHYQARLDLKA